MKKERFVELFELDRLDDREHLASLLSTGEWVMAWDHGQEKAHQGRYQWFKDNMYWVDGVDYDYIMPMSSNNEEDFNLPF